MTLSQYNVLYEESQKVHLDWRLAFALTLARILSPNTGIISWPIWHKV